MKSKKVSSTMFVVLLLLAACLPLLAVSGSKTNETSSDAEIVIDAGFGIRTYIEDIREKPSTNLTFHVWFNYSYRFREPSNIYHNGSIYPGLWQCPMTIPSFLISFGRFSVEVWAGNTYANATGWFIGPFTRTTWQSPNSKP